MPEMAGDIQTNTCRNMPAINWMRNSLMKDARIWAYYDPIFNWAPQWLKDGLCDNANPICTMSGFYNTATSGPDCLEKGAKGAAAIALLTGGAFNPTGDALGLMLGATIAGICEAGVMQTQGYGIDKCVGDMQVSYCPADANGMTVVPDGHVDKTSFSQYSKVPMSPEEQARGQQARRDNPDYWAGVNTAAGAAGTMLGAANALRPADGQIVPSEEAANLFQRGLVDTGHIDSSTYAAITQAGRTGQAVLTTHGNITATPNIVAASNAYNANQRAQPAAVPTYASFRNVHATGDTAAIGMPNCVEGVSLQRATDVCNNAGTGCGGFWRYDNGRVCYKHTFDSGFRTASGGSFYKKQV